MLFWVIFLKTVKVTNLKKLLSNPIVNGTLILTFAGGASRFIGFFYRIFLTRTIGAEGLGIYQLICPVLALSYALCCAGFQTAISKLVAEARDNGRKCLAAVQLHLEGPKEYRLCQSRIGTRQLSCPCGQQQPLYGFCRGDARGFVLRSQQYRN